ncbi:MAG: hypothetical protein PHW95_03180 [Patescibacteria group bacterium]|nr:hypothetical protein [Patescibacteria group bacterium]
MNKLLSFLQSQWIILVVLIVGLLFGFFLGMEYKSYQIQKNLQTFQKDLNQIFSGANKESDKTKEAGTLSNEEKNNYIPKIDISVQVDEFKSIIDSDNIFNGKARRLVGTIKNNSDKEIKKAELLVMFLNENDQSIYENTYNPLYNSDKFEDVILKPNYINEFSFNTDGVPKEWSGKIRYHISDIEY